jgi:hypothetical protein
MIRRTIEILGKQLRAFFITSNSCLQIKS